MLSRWIVFLCVIALVLGGSTWVVLRAHLPSQWRTQKRVLALASVGMVLWTLLLEFAARRWAPVGGGAWRVPVALTRSTVLCVIGVALVLSLASIVRAIVERIVRMVRPTSPRLPDGNETPRVQEPSRREFLGQVGTWAVTTTAAATVGYGALKVARDLHVRDFEITIAGLPSALEGLTIVQLTDVHVGIFTGERDFKAVVERANALRGDVMVLTGDLIDNNPDHVPEAMRLFAKLRAKMGIYAVLGNHDYYTGYQAVLDGLARTGIRSLVNEGIWIPGQSQRQGVALLGLDDVMARGAGRGPNLERAVQQIREDGPRIVLAHNPVMFDAVAGRVDLQLSGHTHGGQINPWGVLDRTTFRYLSGWYQNEESQLIVSNGLGLTGPPVRIGRPPEILRIALTGRSRV